MLPALHSFDDDIASADAMGIPLGHRQTGLFSSESIHISCWIFVCWLYLISCHIMLRINTYLELLWTCFDLKPCHVMWSCVQYWNISWWWSMIYVCPLSILLLFITTLHHLLVTLDFRFTHRTLSDQGAKIFLGPCFLCKSFINIFLTLSNWSTICTWSSTCGVWWWWNFVQCNKN